MTDIQAALGLSQLARLDDFVARRHAIAARYDGALAELPVITPWQHPDGHSGLHLYPIRLAPVGRQRATVRCSNALREAGIGVNLHYIPVHTQPYYRQIGFLPGDFPEAERYASETISLPIYPALGQAQRQVVAALHQILAR